MQASGMEFKQIWISNNSELIPGLRDKGLRFIKDSIMKKIIFGFGFLLFTAASQAQVRPVSPATTPGTSQPRPAYPATGASPGTNTMNNNGMNPSNGTAPGTTYPSTTTTPSYPGTNTTTQPGMRTPGTGTAPQPGTTTPGVRTYSDRDNIINNNPNPNPSTNPAVGNPTINGR